jgi:hypothetical protein
MNRKHRRVLEAVFAEPVRANVNWKDIERSLRRFLAEAGVTP